MDFGFRGDAVGTSWGRRGDAWGRNTKNQLSMDDEMSSSTFMMTMNGLHPFSRIEINLQSMTCGGNVLHVPHALS